MSEPGAEILLFRVGTRVFATAVRDVARIGTVFGQEPEELILDTVLGQPFARDRGIVVALPGAERVLVVDGVLGFRTVDRAALQPLPAFAAACVRPGALAGLVVLDDLPTPFIDLPALVREHEARGGPPPP